MAVLAGECKIVWSLSGMHVPSGNEHFKMTNCLHCMNSKALIYCVTLIQKKILEIFTLQEEDNNIIMG